MVQKKQEYLTRMIRLAEDFFGFRNDPAQISVNPYEMKKLKRIHSATLTEKRTRKGPVAWILIIPTTRELMNQFIKKRISERTLLKKTPLHTKYDTIYLCSALVLPEYRKKGIAKRLIYKAVKSIKKEHPIDTLFYWPFSIAGRKLAAAAAKECKLPLFKRKKFG